jgi:hypothetical protein
MAWQRNKVSKTVIKTVAGLYAFWRYIQQHELL